MKVLVAIPVTCRTHLEEALVEARTAQLVSIHACPDCYPEQNDFCGVEDNEDYQRAVVVERLDLDEKSYEYALRSALRRYDATGLEDRRQIVNASRGLARYLMEVANDYPVGTTVERRARIFYTYGDPELSVLPKRQ